MNIIKKTKQSTDITTLLLHWGMVITLLVSISTGLRIAAMTDSSGIMRLVDGLLLQGNVVRWHFISATLLTGMVAGYIIFLWRSELGGRLTVRMVSLRSPDRQTRLQAINRLIYWVAVAMLTGTAITGTLLYFAPGLLPTEPLITVHHFMSWAFVAYIALHVVAQVVMGGFAQLLKIVTPRMAYGLGGAMAVAAGLGGVAFAYVANETGSRDLVFTKIDTPPMLDGSSQDPVWLKTPEVVVNTSRGFNFKGGEVAVNIRALHDGKKAYILYRWADPSFSQKHIPMRKTAQGWELIHSNYYKNDENEFYEDKFAVMIGRTAGAASSTISIGSKPIADKPAPDNGLGLHGTTDGSLVDVWHWKSVRSGSINQIDDNYFGPMAEAKKGRYTGGYQQDPKTGGGFEQNFDKIEGSPYLKLKYLPKDLAKAQALAGKFNPDPNLSDEGIWAMAKVDVVPYTAEADAFIPVGTVLASVVYDKPFEGDRGDVSAHAQWKNGWWTLEVSRALVTQSKFDVPLATGNFMWVGAFDHNQVRHTRHVLPLKIQIK